MSCSGGGRCPGKYYRALHRGWMGVSVIIIKKNFLAHLVVDVRLISLIDMPVWGNISTELEQKRNVDSTMHQ